MAVFKCKMCGGDLEIVNGESVCECEYCGTKQTIPTTDSEKLTNLYNRANRLRFNNEFDKAAGIFENITAEYPEEAEAYWGLCLCKYGIEYVDDPTTAKKIPTCHRTSLESIFDDSNFELAQEYADSVAQRLYREEAKEIDRLQKAILDIAKNEKPYDIFICYKETAPDGQRTKDSVMAQDIYDALIAKGYKVFFARITLEDKLGQEYEPYIFAALSSAKIMLSVGTSYENFNAVWVKNEWSRYLSLMKTDKSKVLIPCYCDCDAYDMPQEFKNLQGQDMGKVGFIQDLVRGIGKIIPAPNYVAIQNTALVQSQTVIQQVVSSNAENLLKRGMMALEDGKWDEADKFFEQVLNENAEEPRAYFGKLLSARKASNERHLLRSAPTKYSPLTDNEHYKKAVRFAGEEYKVYLLDLNTRYVYSSGMNIFNSASKEEDFIAAKAIFDKIPDYQPAKEKADECAAKAIESIFSEGMRLFNAAKKENDFLKAKAVFERIPHYQNAKEKADECAAKAIESIFSEGMRLFNEAKKENDFLKAKAVFERIPEYRNAKEKADECVSKATEWVFSEGMRLLNSANTLNDLLQAKTVFERIPNYPPAKEKALECKAMYNNSDELDYNNAISLMNSGDYLAAIDKFRKLKNYKDCIDQIYNCAVAAMNNGEYFSAVLAFQISRDHKDARRLLQECIRHLPNQIISSSYGNTIGLKTDGTVVAIGGNKSGQCDVSEWKNIIAVSSAPAHTVGLKDDGTVVAKGRNDDGRCDVSGWHHIIDVSAGRCHTVGLRADGTVVATGNNSDGQCNVSGWEDIIAVSAAGVHTVGLRRDGTVVATGSNEFGQCDVSEWKDIIAVTTKNPLTIGLKADGTVISSGTITDQQWNVSGLKDIIAVSTSLGYTFGLKADGTVITTEVPKDNKIWGKCDVSAWKDIILVSSGNSHVVGLKSDGTVVASGNNEEGRCDVSEWKLFTDWAPIVERREQQRREQETLCKQENAKKNESIRRQIAELEKQKQQLELEISELKGLFSGAKRHKIDTQINEIDSQIMALNMQITKE